VSHSEGTVRPLTESVNEHQRASIEAALVITGGNKTRAAKLLGVPLRTFMQKVKRHGIR
jgi:DNA-binding NtrC family response regulator